VSCTCLARLEVFIGKGKGHPITGHEGPRWRSRGIALLILDLGARRGWVVSTTPRPHCTPGKDPVPIVQEAGWASGPVWTCTKNLAPTEIRSPDRPARSQSLYRLSYRAHRGFHSDVLFVCVCCSRKLTFGKIVQCR
jgi:hypothetical protein